MGLDRLFPVAGHVHIPKGREAGRPALADLLVDSLEHLSAEVVGVILRDGGHHVERERPGSSGSELVFYKGKLYPADVL